MSTNDAEYNGFYIPKGTVMFGNAWLVRPLNSISVLNSSFLFRSILHDPEVFNDPEEFKPERYLKDGKLDPDVRDPDCAVFGFGRRSVNTAHTRLSLIILPSICPGRHLSSDSLYIIASCLLAVYDIKPPVDDQGNSILKLKPESTDGILT